MREWFRLAMSKPVVKRALTYAVVVGAILIMINHSDALLQGKVDAAQIARMALTTPFLQTVADSQKWASVPHVPIKPIP